MSEEALNQAVEPQQPQNVVHDRITDIGIMQKLDSAVLVFRTAKRNTLSITLEMDKAEQLGNRLISAAIANRVIHTLAGFNRRTSGEAQPAPAPTPAPAPQETPAPAVEEEKDEVLPEPPKEIQIQ